MGASCGGPDMVGGLKWEVDIRGLGIGGGGLIVYGAYNGGPGVVRNVPNPAPRIAMCAQNACPLSLCAIVGSLRYGDYELRLRINMLLRMIRTT